MHPTIEQLTAQLAALQIEEQRRREQAQEQLANLQREIEITSVFNEHDTEMAASILRYASAYNGTYEQRNLIIASETQNGKTEHVINFIDKLGENSIIAVSCDNKEDQLDQLVTRMVKKDMNPVCLPSTKNINKKTMKYIKELFNDKKKIVIVMLNNVAQCEKLSKLIYNLLTSNNTVGDNSISYYAIHDEADLINKGDIVDMVLSNEEIAQVHNEWISHFNDLKVIKALKKTTRIWVSATPENCHLLHEVKAEGVFILPTKPWYRGQSEHIPWDRKDFSLIKKEVERIRLTGSKEAILFCSNITKTSHHKKAEIFSSDYECPVIAYNGDGVKIYNDGFLTENFEGPISEALAKLETGYNGPVIIIGHALMNRGISFISSKQSDKPLSATVMFYAGNDKVCAVNVAQRVGRITGTSRPDITRRALYSTTVDYEAYKNYLENQKKIYAALQAPENRDRNVADILKADNLSLQELGRDLDRKTVKKANDGYREATQKQDDDSAYASGDEITDDENSINRVNKLMRKWLNPSNKNAVAEIARELVGAPEYKRLLSDAKQKARELGKASTFINTLIDPNHHTKWHVVFKKEGEYITLTQNAIDFLENN